MKKIKKYQSFLHRIISLCEGDIPREIIIKYRLLEKHGNKISNTANVQKKTQLYIFETHATKSLPVRQGVIHPYKVS